MEGIKKRPHPEEAAKRPSRRTHGADPALRRISSHSSHVRTVISTRRFFWRPSGSSAPLGLVLGATGRLLPQPCVVIAAPTPCAASQLRTESARRSDSFWLYWSLPLPSVWPSISTAAFG